MCLWLLLKHVQNFITEIRIVLTASHYSHICIKSIWNMDFLCTLYPKLLMLMANQKFYWKTNTGKQSKGVVVRKEVWSSNLLVGNISNELFINCKLMTSSWTMLVTWHHFSQASRGYKYPFPWNGLLWNIRRNSHPSI